MSEERFVKYCAITPFTEKHERLCERTGLRPIEVDGMLVRVWREVVVWSAKTGALLPDAAFRLSKETGEKKGFVQDFLLSMVATGFASVDDEGVIHINDWEDHSGAFIKARKKKAEQTAASRVRRNGGAENAENAENVDPTLSAGGVRKMWPHKSEKEKEKEKENKKEKERENSPGELPLAAPDAKRQGAYSRREILDGSLDNRTKKANQSDARLLESLVGWWGKAVGKRRAAKTSQKRKTRLRSALVDYPPSTILKALEGQTFADWPMGRQMGHPGAIGVDDIEHALRYVEKYERIWHENEEAARAGRFPGSGARGKRAEPVRQDPKERLAQERAEWESLDPETKAKWPHLNPDFEGEQDGKSAR